MSEERLRRDLRAVEVPVTPRPEFIDALYARLLLEQGRGTAVSGKRVPARPRRGWRGLTLLAAALLVGGALVGQTLVGSERPAPSPAPTSLPAVIATEPSAEPPTARATATPPAPGPPAGSPIEVSPLPPSLDALHEAGELVYERFAVDALSRLRFLTSDPASDERVPDVPGLQDRAAWSPDGQRLAFHAYDPDGGGTDRIWEADADGANARLLSTSCTPPSCLGESDPAYSPDGRRMAFTRTTGPDPAHPTSAVLAIRDLGSGDVVEFESTRRAADTFLMHPTWSPDGAMLAYAVVTAVAGEDTTTSIWRVGADDRDPRRLTPEGLDAGDPAWSPDGTRILFTTKPVHAYYAMNSRPIDDMRMYTMAPDGSGVEAFGLADPVGAAAWTPDGSQILFTRFLNAGRTLGVAQLMVMDADGANAHALVRNSGCCSWYVVQRPMP